MEKHSRTLSKSVSGPTIATFVCLEFLLSLSINLFIVMNTLISLANRRKRTHYMKKSSSYFSSTVFLFNLALANFLMTILFVFLYVIAAAAGEWIYGNTEMQRDITCVTAAFIFSYTVSLSLTTLAAVSFDKFLFIVKGGFHKEWMKPKAVLSIVALIWIYALFLAAPVFFGGKNYAYSNDTGTCLPWLIGIQPYAIFYSAASLVPISIIVVTTVWTFVFTRRFLRKDYLRRSEFFHGSDRKSEKSVYFVKVRNLIGVFGSLLLNNILVLLPYYVTKMIAFAVGVEKIPSAVYATCLIMFLFSNVSNSLIQLYFRQDTLLTFCFRSSKKVTNNLTWEWQRNGTNRTTACTTMSQNSAAGDRKSEKQSCKEPTTKDSNIV